MCSIPLRYDTRCCRRSPSADPLPKRAVLRRHSPAAQDLLSKAPTNWQPARQRTRGPVGLHCPPYRTPLVLCFAFTRMSCRLTSIQWGSQLVHTSTPRKSPQDAFSCDFDFDFGSAAACLSCAVTEAASEAASKEAQR
jgi:hypothetical protein